MGSNFGVPQAEQSLLADWPKQIFVLPPPKKKINDQTQVRLKLCSNIAFETSN